MKDILRILKHVLLVCLLVFIIFKWVILPVRIIGESMYPTMRNREKGISLIIGKYFNIDRFDIVVLYEHNALIIKRVIGLPGETLEVREDQLYINGDKVDEPFFDENYRQAVINNNDIPFTHRVNKIELGPDQYFVMGDNRPRSQDSRFFGPVSRSEILSKGFYPLNFLK